MYVVPVSCKEMCKKKIARRVTSESERRRFKDFVRMKDTELSWANQDIWVPGTMKLISTAQRSYNRG